MTEQQRKSSSQLSSRMVYLCTVWLDTPHKERVTTERKEKRLELLQVGPCLQVTEK